MKKSLLIVLAVVFFATNCFAFGFDSKGVKLAKDHYDMGQVNTAISTLQSWVRHNDPKDYEAYMLLGQYRFEQKSYRSSAESYALAFRLNDSKRDKVLARFENQYHKLLQSRDTGNAGFIADQMVLINTNAKSVLYENFLDQAKNANDVKFAIANLKLAKKFAVSMVEKINIGNEYSNLAIAQLKIGNINSAKKLVALAHKNGHSARSLSTSVYEIGNKIKPANDKMVDIYAYAFELSGNQQTDASKTAAKEIESYARSIENSMIFSEKVAGMIEMAKGMTNERVRTYSKIYNPNSYAFNVAKHADKNKRTKFWIKPADETMYKIEDGNKKEDNDISLLLEDGSEIKVLNGIPKNIGFFKIIFGATKRAGLIIKPFDPKYVASY